MIIKQKDISKIVHQTGLPCSSICIEFYELKNGTTLVTNGSEWLSTSRSLDEAIEDFSADDESNELALDNWYTTVDNVIFEERTN